MSYFDSSLSAMLHDAQVSDLLGKILIRAEQNKTHSSGDQITFTTNNGEQYVMYHSQNCCESVTIEDIAGDLQDLVGSPLTMAEVVENHDTDNKDFPDHADSSHTWTFYKFATVKGYVTIRWFGTSNGYYSESVDFVKTSTAKEN